MGHMLLADSGLAPWGQAAAIILALYLFITVILGLVLTAALMFTLTWLREKAELLKKVRPAINQVNYALETAQRGEPLPPELADNQFAQVVSQIPRVAATLPARASAVEQKVEQGSDRVVHAVIEFRARTEMVKGMARAFFLPGLTRSRARPAPQTSAQREQEPVVTQSEDVTEPPSYEEMTMVQRIR